MNVVASTSRTGRYALVGRRVLITMLAVIVGWVVGVYSYVGLLYVVDDGPGPDDIPIGAGLLGLVGMVGLGIAAWHWSARLSDSSE